MATSRVKPLQPRRHVPVSNFAHFGAVMALIFCVEAAVMFALEYLPSEPLPIWTKIALDATLLMSTISAAIWWFFVRPLDTSLRSEAARAQAVLDAATEGIITIDERGIIESFNPAAERMFGYAAAEVIGGNVGILMPELEADAHDRHLARYLRTGEKHAIGRSREVPARRKDGTQFPIELNVTEIRFGKKRRFTGIFRDISERKETEERIRRLAHYDNLTGLPNRALFYDRLKQAISLARRDHHQMALLYVDLDDFKTVNDRLGHDAGDELLKKVAERLQQLVRESDTVARIGGDEFTVTLPEVRGRNDAEIVAQKIIEALRPNFHLGEQQHEARIGASIGIAIYPDDAQDMEALVKAADIAMYIAKQTGNCFRSPSSLQQTRHPAKTRQASRKTPAT
ncbi:MAG: diguanylate cyclase domain-containing protein [Burkholderiales bacterium]